eukprot:m.137308 g.137308  ORF g.137308 m.137308 type:complete len:1083 (-) comp14005_c0_seq2:4683-7931(-)
MRLAFVGRLLVLFFLAVVPVFLYQYIAFHTAPHLALDSQPTNSLDGLPSQNDGAVANDSLLKPPQHQPPPQVCIVGNAETLEAAQHVHAMWRLPSLWYIWGEHVPPTQAVAHTLQHRANNLAVAGSSATKQQALPFTSGIELCVEVLLNATGAWCQYIFTHDDDLEFSLAPETDLPQPPPSADTQPALTTVLLAILTAYHPAIASFPWQVGLDRFPQLKRIFDEYKASPVAPLTAFDNGMVLYHRDVLDFFIPFAPRGEGGFVGKWTLGAHFLQVFAPGVFGEYAICIKALRYTNNVNLDNRDTILDPKRRRHGKHVGNLVYYEGVRHPYEHPLNNKYLAFLRGSLLDQDLKVGRDLELEETTPPAPRPVPDNSATTLYPAPFVFQRLKAFADPAHAAFLHNRFVQVQLKQLRASSLPPQAARKPSIRSSSPNDAFVSTVQSYQLIVHVFAFNRPNELQHLLDDINAMLPLPTSAQASLSTIIHVDGLPSSEVNEHVQTAHAQVINVAKAFRCVHGPVHLDIKHKHTGLRSAITTATQSNASYPEQPNGKSDQAHSPTKTFLLMLEDDLRLSRFALLFAHATILRYYILPSSRRKGGLFGISLYAQRFNEVNERDLPPHMLHMASGLTYAWDMPQSWGAVYLKDDWDRFTNWFTQQLSGTGADTSDPPQFLLPDSLANRWPAQTSWKKACLRYMAEQDLFLVYPRFGQDSRLSWSTNTLAVGTNDRLHRRSSSRRLAEDRFSLDLVGETDLLQLFASQLGLQDNSPKSSATSSSHLHHTIANLLQLMPTLDDLQRYNRLGQREPLDAKRTPTETENEASFDTCHAVIYHHNAISAKVQLRNAVAAVLTWRSIIGHITVLSHDNLTPIQGQGEPSLPSSPITTTVLSAHVATTRESWLVDPQLLQQISAQQARFQCILLLDTSLDFDYKVVHYAVRAWQAHFFDHLVSVAELGTSRKHGYSGKHASVVLPGLTVVKAQRVLALGRSAAARRNPQCAATQLSLLVSSKLHELKVPACPLIIAPNTPISVSDDMRQTLVAQSSCIDGDGNNKSTLLASMRYVDMTKSYGSSTPLPARKFLQCVAD